MALNLDPKIVEVGQKYFDMNMPNLTVHIGDGRWNLEQSKSLYDIIAVDAYRPPYIPPHMTTQEFFQICASHLTEDGVLTLNVGSVPGDRRLIDGLATTMGTIFSFCSYHGYSRHIEHYDLCHETKNRTHQFRRQSFGFIKGSKRSSTVDQHHANNLRKPKTRLSNH